MRFLLTKNVESEPEVDLGVGVHLMDFEFFCLFLLDLFIGYFFGFLYWIFLDFFIGFVIGSEVGVGVHLKKPVKVVNIKVASSSFLLLLIWTSRLRF